jgi:hypothetical protein
MCLRFLNSYSVWVFEFGISCIVLYLFIVELNGLVCFMVLVSGGEVRLLMVREVRVLGLGLSGLV